MPIPEGGSARIVTEDDVEQPASSRGANRWAMWGQTPSRNNVVQSEKKSPTDFDTDSERNIRWSTPLGSQTYGSPVVSGGKVFVGTNNGHGYIRRYPSTIDLGCLVCFDQETGDFQWQHSNEKLSTGRIHDWPLQGIVSTPLVGGDRLWYVTNRSEVVCLDTEGFRDGENDGPVTDEPQSPRDADVVWKFDMMKQLDISPHHVSGSTPVTDGERLFVMTNNGSGAEVFVAGDHVPKPHAPSFAAFDLKTGALQWTAKASDVCVDCQWGGPTYAVVDGQPQVLMAGGDGWLYSFDPAGDGVGNAQLLWKFDANPKDAKYAIGGTGRKNLHISTPVVVGDLVYFATGRNPEQGEGDADLWCIKPRSSATDGRDLSPMLVMKDGKVVPPRRTANFVEKTGERMHPNPNSAVVWHYAGRNSDETSDRDFEDAFHRTWGSPAIANGLLIISDFSGLVHCVDANSGNAHWTYDLFAACWSSPLVVNDMVYVGDEDGDLSVFRLSKTLELIAEPNFDHPIYSTPTMHDGTFFISTSGRLIAIEEE